MATENKEGIQREKGKRDSAKPQQAVYVSEVPANLQIQGLEEISFYLSQVKCTEKDIQCLTGMMQW